VGGRPRAASARCSSSRRSSAGGEFWKVFVPSLTGMIGFWATLSLNIPDFTRYGRGQREQMLGQTLGLPTTMIAFSAMGVVITSASRPS
jgi:NCS1 family nucleobase:cation symporter-1